MRTPRFLAVVAIALGASLTTSATAQAAQAPVSLGVADAFTLLAGAAVTNTGPSVLTGDLGLHPGTSVTGFPPGIVNGTQHVTDAVALQAKADLVTAYDDAAGRAQTATASPDIGGQVLTPGVYRTGGVPTMQLTGTVTLDAQGDPNAVFIFQVASALTTATDSSVVLANGAQSCNVFWQVGSDVTLGTRTSFRGTVLAMNAITVNDAVTVRGRLLARTAAVTLINDTITRVGCAEGTTGGVVGGGDDALDDGTSGGGGGGGGGGIAADDTAPTLVVSTPHLLITSTPRPTRREQCVTTSFRVRIAAYDPSRIRMVYVFVDGERVKRTMRARSTMLVGVRGIRVGTHRVTVIAIDRAGNRRTVRRVFDRCELGAQLPQFAG